MTSNIPHKTFESFSNKVEKFKKELETSFKYFSNSPGEWDSADILSEITDLVTDNHITVYELKNFIDENRNIPYYKYLRMIYKEMVREK